MLHACTAHTRFPGGADNAIVSTVETMLKKMEAGREEAAMEYMMQLDQWPEGMSPVVTPEMVDEQTSRLPAQV